MAIVTNTVTRYDAYRSIREDLADIIYNISPVDVPFMSNIGRDKAKSTFTEWQTDSLAAATTANAQLEGDDVVSTSGAQTMTNRVGNYTQISRKLIEVSGTVEATDKAGMRSALAYFQAKAAAELKRDMESTLTGGQIAVIGNTTVARQTAGLGAWIITNYTPGTGTVGAAPAMSSGSDGYPATAAVAGTTQTFTETLLKASIQKVWTQGGSISDCFLMVGPANKQFVSTFTGIATRYRDVAPGKQASIVGAADIYVSDFGTINVVPNRFQPEKFGYIVNPEYASVAYLRPFQTINLAQTGDAQKRMILVEYALKVRAEKSMANTADLKTSYP